MQPKKMQKQMGMGKAFSLLKKYKIPSAEYLIVKKADAAAKAAGKIGFPVAMKAVSEKIIHKSDIGCVKAGISSSEEAAKAFEEIIKNAKARAKVRPEGVIVQKMESGTEVIIGLKKDPQFGPVVLLGLGGIFVEVMNDVSLRIAPLEKSGCLEMIDELKGSKILKGARGRKPVNIDSIVNILMAVSSIGMKNKNIAEMDLNPVIVNESSAKAVDVRIIVGK